MKKLIFILILLNTFGVFAEKPKLAVMNFTDETEGRLSKDLVKNGSKLIRSRFTRNAKEFFEVVTDKENEAALAAMKKESHRLDRDRNFQIELGKQVSAAKIIMSTIGTLDKKTFLITSTLTDVARGVDETSADAIFDGTAKGLSNAVDEIIIKLLGFEDPKKPKKSEGQIMCEEARTAGSEQKWKSFLKYYADEYPECVPEARKQLEEIAFHKANRKNTVEAWQEYLEEYPIANKRHVIEAEEQIEKLKKGGVKKQPSGNISESNNNDAAILGDLLPEYNEYMKIKFDNISFPKEHKGYELLQLGFDVENGKIIHHGDFDPDELYPEEKALVRAAAKIKDDFNNISQARIAKKVELSVILSKTLESKVYPGQTHLSVSGNF